MNPLVWVRQEWGVLKQAPGAFVILFFVGVLAGFVSTDKMYSHELSSARQDRDIYKDQLETLQNKVKKDSDNMLHNQKDTPTKIPTFYDMIKEWGIHLDRPPSLRNAYGRARLDTRTLSKFADKYKTMVILRLVTPSVDRMTDTVIAKSPCYTITGDTFDVSVPISAQIAALAKETHSSDFELNFVLLPKENSGSDINSLSDVARVHGLIMYHAGLSP